MDPHPLTTALRNAHIIQWLRSQPVETLSNLTALYAGHLQCPLDEVIPLDQLLEDGMLDEEILSWIHALFGSQIDK